MILGKPDISSCRKHHFPSKYLPSGWREVYYDFLQTVWTYVILHTIFEDSNDKIPLFISPS